MTVVLLVAAKFSVMAIILAIGLRAAVADIFFLWTKPGLLVRSMIAMYIAVPLLALILVTILPVSPGIKAALLVLAVSAGAPLLPRKIGDAGRGDFALSLVVISSLLAVLIVPAWVALLSWYFDVATSLSALKVAGSIAQVFLLPLAVGMAVNAMAPELSNRFAERILTIAGLVLVVSGITLLATHWTLVMEVRWPGAVALITLIAAAVAVGHVLGGPNPEDRTTLALACATRHVGIAVVVATSFPGPRTLVLLVTYVLASALVSIPYLRWRRHVASASAGR